MNRRQKSQCLGSGGSRGGPAKIFRLHGQFGKSARFHSTGRSVSYSHGDVLRVFEGEFSQLDCDPLHAEMFQ
jgi:hypothetical protein